MEKPDQGVFGCGELTDVVLTDVLDRLADPKVSTSSSSSFTTDASRFTPTRICYGVG